MQVLALYPRLLGAAWSTLPGPLRACHDAAPRLVATGRFRVTHARSWLARLAIAMVGMPAAGDDVALRLEVRAEVDHQIWARDFDGFRMTTIQSLLPDGRMGERRGFIEALFDVTAESGEIVYRPAGLRLRLGRLRVPIPSWCGPRAQARTWCVPGDDSMHVHVTIAAPVLGLLVTYSGAIAPIDG